MKAQLISIGNELLIGDTINTNASWMGQFLTELGFEVTQVHTISDEPALIQNTLRQSLEDAQLVITTGGLGPTHDDLTKKAIADLFGMDMRLDPEVLAFIKELFEKRNIPFSASNQEQAEIPDGAEVLFNKAGTAPGIWFDRNGKYVVVLPGVPYEMKYLMKYRVADKLREVFGDVGFFHHRYLKTAGIGESTLSDQVLGDLSGFLNDGVSMAFLPYAGGVTLRLNGSGDTKEEARASVQELADTIYERAGHFIFGEGKELTLSEAVGTALKKHNLTIATAESCTGGLVGDHLTNTAGSSAYVQGGIISYSNSVKVSQLGVTQHDLDSVGAVSKEVALHMAKGVAERLGADIGISTTGIAGPGGGTEQKPVGTVWMGFWSADQHFAVRALFTKDRIMNKQRTMMVVLEIVRRTISGIEELPYNLQKHTV
ncbi:MAG: competence/damage-inducible protein A [Bacteroidota bacterium]